MKTLYLVEILVVGLWEVIKYSSFVARAVEAENKAFDYLSLEQRNQTILFKSFSLLMNTCSTNKTNNNIVDE